MKFPSVTITTCGDKVEVLYAGLDKGEAVKIAKEACDKPVKELTEVRVLTAQSCAFRKRLVPALVESPEATGPDAAELRKLLEEKGVKVPAKVTDDRLIQLATEHGVG